MVAKPPPPCRQAAATLAKSPAGTWKKVADDGVALLPVYPELQLQSAGDMEAACDTAAASHAVQPCDPGASLYVFAEQAVHCPPFGPVNPLLQTQSTTWALPVVATFVLAGHGVHASAAEPGAY